MNDKSVYVEYECLGEVVVVIDPVFARMRRVDDCHVYLLAFKLLTLYQLQLFTTSISLYPKPSKVEAG